MQCNLLSLHFTGTFCCIKTVHLHCFSKLYSLDHLDNDLSWFSNHCVSLEPSSSDNIFLSGYSVQLFITEDAGLSSQKCSS